jgi:hypothetical protein
MRAQLARSFLVLPAGLVICGLLITVTAPATEAKADGDDESPLFGDWKGESIVVAKGSAAKDEVVVWHISKAKEPGKVRVTADKIVNGQSITMGTGDWDYDKSKKTITWKNKVGVWKLSVDGDTMKGTLTLADRTVFRRVSLQRSGSGHRRAG